MKRIRVVEDCGGEPLSTSYEAVVLDDQDMADFVRMKSALRDISQSPDGTPLTVIRQMAREALPR
jgi:hypothetical protein